MWYTAMFAVAASVLIKQPLQLGEEVGSGSSWLFDGHLLLDNVVWPFAELTFRREAASI